MIVLDDILESQRLLLEASRIAPRQIGVDFAQKGLKDYEIVNFLRQLRRVTP
ncbi:MAG: hypothetical protein U0Q16_20910 [Bryobacteraceae bacterium]